MPMRKLSYLTDPNRISQGFANRVRLAVNNRFPISKLGPMFTVRFSIIKRGNKATWFT